MHKEFRRHAQMPLGVMSKPCTCCRKWEKKKHWCSHQFCLKPCRKQDEIFTKGTKDSLPAQSYVSESYKTDYINNETGQSPIVIPVYPAGMPQGGVKRQRGRPKKIRPEEMNEVKPEDQPMLVNGENLQEAFYPEPKENIENKDNGEVKENDSKPEDPQPFPAEQPPKDSSMEVQSPNKDKEPSLVEAAKAPLKDESQPGPSQS